MKKREKKKDRNEHKRKEKKRKDLPSSIEKKNRTNSSRRLTLHLI